MAKDDQVLNLKEVMNLEDLEDKIFYCSLGE